MSAWQDPSRPPEEEPKKRKGFSPGLLALSIGLHALFFLVAGYMVVQEVVLKRKMQFAAPPPAPSATRAVEHRVTLQRKRNAGGSPPQARRIAVAGKASAITLPEMPAMPQTQFVPGRMAGMAGAGLGAGFGIGTGTGMGVGSLAKTGLGLTMFAAKSTGDIVFVIDVSGSNVIGTKSRESYDELEAEAVKAIRLLPPNVKFNVIAFSSEAKMYDDKKLISASVSTKEGAVRWLKNFSPSLVLPKGVNTVTSDEFFRMDKDGKHQGTNTKDALAKAFSLHPTTIVFVSDGAPSNSSPQSIMEAVKGYQGQASRKAVINTIAYKADSGEIFLQQLAEQNGGAFRNIE